MTYPAPGISVQEAYWEAFNITFVDTFYQDSLRKELVNRYRNARHAIFGVVDALAKRVFEDTTWIGDTFYIDKKVEETLDFRVLKTLQGEVPETFRRKDTAYYYEPPLTPTTYRSLVGKPFIALFDTYDHVKNMGLGPEDGCFFEFQAYALEEGGIIKKGVDGQRMPGVSVPLDHFLAGAAAASMPGLVKTETASRPLRFGLGRRKVRHVAPDRGP
jgi:hypothetical protein